MNKKFIFLLLVVTTLMPMFDAATEAISCSNPNDCREPCKKQTGCSGGKCMNRKCKCHRCNG
uniref:Toxin La-alphaKTx4 n=1 Tax=Liocheles australasiae TaxID=431266 RepID=KAX64_LIOAU